MRIIKSLATIGLLTALAGCASAAKVENMAYAVPSGQQGGYDAALQQQVRMGFVGGGTDTNPLAASEIETADFSEAVRQSLALRGLHSESGKFELTVMLLRVDKPFGGLNMTVTTTVQYILKDSESDEVVFDETVVAPHTASMGDAFIGSTRLRLANEGSARKNIQGFMEALASLEVPSEEIEISVGS